MSAAIAGLDLSAVGTRLDAAGIQGEDRARAIEVLIGIEAGVLQAVAQVSAERGEE